MQSLSITWDRKELERQGVSLTNEEWQDFLVTVSDAAAGWFEVHYEAEAQEEDTCGCECGCDYKLDGEYAPDVTTCGACDEGCKNE